MAVTKITWENKTGIQNDASVARKNKVVDEDMNEIKQVVNNNADEVTTMQETIEDLQEGQGTSDTDITNLKNRVTTLEEDNTENKSNISSLQEQFSNFKNYDDTEIKEDISDIKKEQETQNTDIENLQINDNKQDELISKLKNALINAETEEAKSLHVMDANKFGQLEVLGNQEQETRSGKNRFKLPDSGNNNGIIYTNNGDGTFNISGTAQEQANFLIVVPLENSGFEQGKSYTVSSNIEIGNIKYYVHSCTASGVWNKTLLDFVNETSKTKEMPEPSTDYISLNIAVFKDVTVNYQNVTVQIEEGTVATEYEQYGASPSPDYPSKVVCLGSNKQLFNKDQSTIEKGSINTDGTFTNSNTRIRVYDISLKGNKTYTVSLKDNNLNIVPYFYDEEGTFISYLNGWKTLPFTFKMPNNAKILKLLFRNKSDTEITAEDILNADIKIEEGTEATSYSPYGQGSTLISKINKNFLNLNNLEVANNNGIDTYSIDNPNQITLKNKATTSGIPYNYAFQAFHLNLPQGDYNLSAKTETNSTNYRIIIRGKKDGSNATSTEVLSQSKNNGNFNIDYSQCDEYAIEFYANQSYVEQLVTTTYYDIQIQKGNIATDYIEHQQEDYLLYIQQEMLQGDYFIKEDDGWKEVHNYSKKIFDRMENWIKSGSSTDDMFVAALNLTNAVAGYGYSNYFKYNQQVGIGFFSVYNNGMYIRLCVDGSQITTIDEFKAWLQEKYDEGNPVYVFYKTKTSTKLACTPEQSAVLEELSNMDLFEGVNNIITAEDIALLKLKYALDVETYIDNKLNTINQQILNIAGGN